MSIDTLIGKIKETGSPVVAGLDPKLEYVPDYLVREMFEKYGRTKRGVAQAILAFNKALLDDLAGAVPAVKPQSAYYEMYGLEGLSALSETIKYAKQKGLYVILDVKRNDIGSTAEAYAEAYLGGISMGDGLDFDDFPCDAVTINPYLGTDGIFPFVKLCEKNGKMVFVLVKTSNPSSGELQDLDMAGGGTLYENVAQLVNRWGLSTYGENGYSGVGAVVGATYPEQAAKLRALMPKAYFLVPGYGAQGGKAEDVAKSFNKDGLGAIVNSSRGIMCAYKKGDYQPEEFAKAAREEALRMKYDILRFL